MKRRLIPILPAIAALAFVAAAAAPAEYTDFSELDLEDLLNQTIVTAAKHTQKLSDAPVAAVVITAEEIAASGARSIPELLRTVPGLDVLQATSSGFDVSARGLNKPGSNSMLVLIDGRSVYLDFYGLVVWDKLPVSMEDIKAIEVIKGPGSAMHGANAFAGVINIITFTAAEKPGSSTRVMASDLGESYGSFRHAAGRNNLSWKVTTAWDRGADWRSDIVEAENVRFEGQVRMDLGDDSWISTGAGHIGGHARTFTPALLEADGSTDYARADFVRGDLALRWYTNIYEGEVDPLHVDLTGGVATLKSRMHDVEIQRSQRPGRGHHLLLGGSYRHLKTSFSQTGVDADEDVYAAFLLEEWSPRDYLLISAGLRYEQHSLVGANISPRGGIVVKPSWRHQVRLSYGKAFRNPSYIETYWRTDYELPMRPPLPDLTQTMRGDLGNRSEEIEAVELGYQGLVRECLLVTASLFRNRIDGLITTQTIAYHPPPLDAIPREIGFRNALSWRAIGGELSLRADPRPWLRMVGQYWYVRLEDSDTGDRIAKAPAHAASLTGRARMAQGHYLQLVGRYRSESSWEGLTFEPRDADLSGERLVMDAAWQIYLAGGGHRVTLAGENLFDKRFRDHPEAIEQRRRWAASVTVSF